MTVKDLTKGDLFTLIKGITKYEFVKYKSPYIQVKNKYKQNVYLSAKETDKVLRIDK